MDRVMFSSATDEWETPQALFDRLHRVFGFDVDVCATLDNAKCLTYITKQANALLTEWGGTCWMNPPYGRDIGKWVEHAYTSAKRQRATVVCLLPARTDTRWWHDYCIKGEVTFLKGRLKFGNAKHNAPFPSAIVVFRPLVADAFAEDKTPWTS